jgi:hypothetical protein
VDVLREVVVAAAILTALPITCAEGHYAASAPTHVATTHAVAVTTHVVGRWAHHARVAITVRIAHGLALWWALLHGGEGAPKAGCTTLEVGETT